MYKRQDQQPIDIRKPSHAIAAGMMLCPEDRKAEGIIPVSYTHLDVYKRQV